jgi:hypothetical protein
MQFIIILLVHLNYTCSEVHIDEHLSDALPVQNGLAEDATWPLIFSVALKYALRKVHENRELKLNGTFQLMIYANIHFLGENINAIRKSMEALLHASEEVGLKVNTEKTKCIFTSCHQTTGQNHNVRVTN